VKTAGEEESAEAAWTRMQLDKIHHLIVVRDRKVVGVISDRDLGGRAGASIRGGRRVGELMTRHTITASSDTTVKRAANLLRGRTIGCLPIVDGAKLVGIVTTADLLELLGRGIERPVPSTRRWTLKHRGPRRKPAPARI
jgi:acetoin utilization protein AcuB